MDLRSAVTRAELAAVPSVLPLVGMDHPALRAKARPFAPDAYGSPELARVIASMWRTLDRIGHGVGLAAPQVGLDIRLFIVDDHEGRRFTMVDPRRIGLPSLERETTIEGCLSIPGFWAQVDRPLSRTVEGFDAQGEPIRVAGKGFLARILEHESDHLDGRLYVDRMDPATFGPDPRGSFSGQRVWTDQAPTRLPRGSVRRGTGS